jgi:predicted DCC family thiol-disulfide oxidoreductase YuxK
MSTSIPISASISDSPDDLWVVYDGECPFCSRYVLLYRLRDQGLRVHLIDARSGHPLVAAIGRLGLDLDAGMVVGWRGAFHHGAAAVHLLALLGDERTVFNRLNRVLFSRPWLARRLYPWLAAGRRLTLRLLGRRPIGEPGSADHV